MKEKRIVAVSARGLTKTNVVESAFDISACEGSKHEAGMIVIEGWASIDVVLREGVIGVGGTKEVNVIIKDVVNNCWGGEKIGFPEESHREWMWFLALRFLMDLWNTEKQDSPPLSQLSLAWF